MAAALTVRNVRRSYEGRDAVADASFELQAGRIACLLGPSGCGKSTLLRLVAGLEPVDAGSIELGDTTVSTPHITVPPEARGVGLVFQDFALFPHLNVADNIGFGLRGMAPSQRQQRVAAMLAHFHLEDLAQAWPHTLSGGEQQRVAFARALARAPSVLLLDEPFSGLDGALRTAVREAVLADLRAAGATVLVVTHDPDEALLMADDLMLMAEGRILQRGSPEQCYLRPVSVAAARLLGEAVLLPARVEGGLAHTAFGTVAAPGVSAGAATLMARPEALRLDDAGTSAEVIDVRFCGAFHAVTVRAQDSTIAVRTAGPPPAVGARAGVVLDPLRTVVYPAG